MTRIEKVFLDYGHFALQWKIMGSLCPGGFLAGEPKVDKATQVTKGRLVIGCRGIKCQKCWHQGVGEQND